jgi:hypothetical protein
MFSINKGTRTVILLMLNIKDFFLKATHYILIYEYVNTVSIATGYRLDNQGVGIRVKGKQFLLLHIVQTGSGVHPTSYTKNTGGYFPGGKAAAGSS